MNRYMIHIPNNPLSTTDFLRETTHDNWQNIRTLLNLPENSRCTITQEILMIMILFLGFIIVAYVFNRDALVRWFERDSRCPICRYNLSRNTFFNSRQNTTILRKQYSSNNTSDISRNSTDLSNNKSINMGENH